MKNLRDPAPRLGLLSTAGLIALCGFTLATCSSFSILKPAQNATVESPIAADIFWNEELQESSFRVVLDPGPGQSDVTNRFPAPSLLANSHVPANLNLSQGPHTLAVSGNLKESGKFTPRSTARSFVVANGVGRPVTYTETVYSIVPGWPAGKLGDITFGGTGADARYPRVNLVFTFEGNTNDVVSFYVPRTSDSVQDGVGFEIVAGTATITIQNADPLSTIAKATFLPGDGIFVSVDNGNDGLGFGYLGALPGDPAFPDGIEVAYPYAMFMDRSIPTDLKGFYTNTSSWALSTIGFGKLSPSVAIGPDGCAVPPPLATTAGILTINSNCHQDVSGRDIVAALWTTEVH